MVISQNLNKILPKQYPEIKKGDTIRLTVFVDGDLQELVSGAFDLDVFFNSWEYMAQGKTLRPFKLMKYTREGSIKLEADIKMVRKAKDTNELKLICQDLMDVLNFHHIRISSLIIECI
ncbi:hypothetical protein A8990_13234 [Paenibacillus taihuensis]|uniref:Uncharacterized protein n=1 Tax=Paenibacillus taihuensis TaxID=1156355 RepID=A0A3D9QW60_9BACL|nr:hypothetical protein [Paenibacillus taihuensis]REE69637.1 hypothetical protein A8990_13234 [Paenibacillus taihuensis]